ncbi:MAG: hypothetical protein ABIV48_10425 [Pyrinomonadaceae bacterium]
MKIRIIKISFFAAMFAFGSIYCFAQMVGADNRTVTGKQDESEDDNRPRSFRETLTKLRIDKEKKEYDEMVERAEEAVKISEELEKAFEQNGNLTAAEVSRLAAAEKLVKKIRSELGGNDDGDKSKELGPKVKHFSRAELIKSFRTTSVDLVAELKRTTRFTVSAAAIQTSNALLMITKFLRNIY